MRGEFVGVAGCQLYYFAAGTRGAGVPVVLLHGFPTSSRLWQGVVRDFPAGHRLVVCDLPGYGRSEAGAAGVGVAALADSVLGLLDDLRIARACLVGHGLGGAVAQTLAVRAPARVSHLALIGSPAVGIPPRRMARLARALVPIARLLPPGLLAGLVHGSVRRGFDDPERSRLTLDTCLKPFTTPTGRDTLARHLRALDDAGTDASTRRLAPLAIPTTIVWGADDPFYPAALAHDLHDALPHAAIEIVPGARHFLPEDAPERVLAALRALLTR